MRNNCSVNFYLSKLSIAKFSILYDIPLVRDWKRKLNFINMTRKCRRKCLQEPKSNFPQINQMTFKRPYMGTRPIKYYTEPVVSCVVLGQAAAPKSLKMPKEQRKKLQVCSVILHWSTFMYIAKLEGHLVYLGEISEQCSLIRETDHDQPPWWIYVILHKGWAACDWDDNCNTHQVFSHLFLHSFPRFNKLCSPFSCSCHSFHQSSGYTMTNTKCEAPDEIYN